MKYLLILLFIFSLKSVYAYDQKRTSVSWQLGPDSSSYNVDFGVSRGSTIGLHYQNQFAQNTNSKSTYMLRGLSNYGVNYEYFLGPNLERFKSGLVLTAGVHYTKLSEDSIHHEVTYEQKETLKPGDAVMGGRLAASYRWYSKSIFVGLGIEGSKTGKAVTFLPAKVQLGLVF